MVSSYFAKDSWFGSALLIKVQLLGYLFILSYSRIDICINVISLYITARKHMQTPNYLFTLPISLMPVKQPLWFFFFLLTCR